MKCSALERDPHLEQRRSVEASVEASAAGKVAGVTTTPPARTAIGLDQNPPKEGVQVTSHALAQNLTPAR
jgi:hypothetical protein